MSPDRSLTQGRADDTPFGMTNPTARGVRYGPWLVALGAALWGTESAWRIPLNDLFDARVIVFWEHILILLMFLPILIVRLKEIPRIDSRTWGYLLFSGFAGSAVGTVFFTLALKNGNPTVVNVVLNIQPVISTIGACLLFGDRLAPRFFPRRSLCFRHFSLRHHLNTGRPCRLTQFGNWRRYLRAFGTFHCRRSCHDGTSLRPLPSLRIVVGCL